MTQKEETENIEDDPKAEQEKLKNLDPFFPTKGILSALNPGISYVVAFFYIKLIS